MPPVAVAPRTRWTDAPAGQLRAAIEAGLDAVVVMDAGGAIASVNRAAELTFAIDGRQVVGRDMADVLVPERLRAAHRAGLTRLLSGAEPVLLGRRVEVPALHASGREIPVELSITRLADPAGPLFVASLRDLTERHEAEEALRASRARIVEASDTARRRVERDLHDGAQQRLMLCSMLLRELTDELGDDAAEAVRLLLSEASGELRAASQELRELARGIHPAVLSVGGLVPALRTAVARCPIPVELDAGPERRYPEAVETTAYFTVLEALTNVARGVDATRVRISVRTEDGHLLVIASDDGRGGADPSSGSGLAGLADRAAAVGGSFHVDSPVGHGTTLRARLPLQAG